MSLQGSACSGGKLQGRIFSTTNISATITQFENQVVTNADTSEDTTDEGVMK